MSGCDGVGLVSYSEVSNYLQDIGEGHLLKYVREQNGRCELVADMYAQVKLESVRYQIACILMLLGEYTRAEEIYRPRWVDLSSWGDKIGNDLLKHFMKAYSPRQKR